MLQYLTMETNFLRAFGNRSLILIFLCVLTRTSIVGKAAVLGISVDFSPGTIVIAGPFLAAILMLSLRVEANSLIAARREVLSEITRRTHIDWWIYFLFFVPSAATIFLILQFAKIVPVSADCEAFDRWRYLYDFHLQTGVPSKFCIRDLVEGMPWIYPPIQLYLYWGIVVMCLSFSIRIAKDWTRYR